VTEQPKVVSAPLLPTLAAEVERLARLLAERRFPELARAMRNATPRMLTSWRTCSVEAMPDLDRFTIDEFEGAIATILEALAGALDSHDPERVKRMIEESPAHGIARFAQKCNPQTLLAEERILRSVVVIELRRELGRVMTAEEAAALHDLLDVMGEHSLLALINKRGEARDRVIQKQVAGMHRLADLGMLVAGMAHDATNLLLPLRMRLERLKHADVSVDVRDDLTAIGLIVKQFQNSIVNLRWLSVDSTHAAAPLPAHARSGVSLDLGEWAAEVAEFHRRMRPSGVELLFELPAGLPVVRISSAALSQAVFNLIHNAQQAVAESGRPGCIVVSAKARDDGGVSLTIEDDGPGMTPDVLQRCAEPFFTTRENGSGLGLALVRALVEGCGGSLEFKSPPEGKERGTAAVLILPAAR
jgi:signal transduction histidine kinase